ncbi:nucleotidyltransferase family protein [Celerinatantimonas yamalensis]|uniref:Nucleotidyltransferase family protein n=1 Tax=Celerinatantimonas yamalensis TaxID=559956 RepID=A0ABW9G5T7_9GAMM
MHRVIELVQNDPLRLEALACANQLQLPDHYLAAGFVRNMVWDHLHHKASPTPLNDVDLIYFNRHETQPTRYLYYEAKLREAMPQLNWQVRNQALMHQRNGDQPYLSSLDAMRYWPEQETAVAIRQVASGQFECASAFGFDALFALTVTHNPKRAKAIFEQRIKHKQWLKQWPNLTILIES